MSISRRRLGRASKASYWQLRLPSTFPSALLRFDERARLASSMPAFRDTGSLFYFEAGVTLPRAERGTSPERAFVASAGATLPCNDDVHSDPAKLYGPLAASRTLGEPACYRDVEQGSDHGSGGFASSEGEFVV